MRVIRPVLALLALTACGGCAAEVCCIRPCGGCYDAVISTAVAERGPIGEAAPPAASASGRMAD
jgi:hypothetical protein